MFNELNKTQITFFYFASAKNIVMTGEKKTNESNKIKVSKLATYFFEKCNKLPVSPSHNEPSI